MTTKPPWTKGPWEVEEHDEAWGTVVYVVPESGGFDAEIGFADVSGWNARKNKAELDLIRANARLIALAPEMAEL